ncbi:SDR family oxidoreductase [Paraburkholderia megapolitana]|uniref:Nucleoside-diphosphate-sugar epimerase n=1 Tax=Paraburkholderia megapolitana TaxID=420953 RepID=A0A1I3DJ75_9BURK|nr:SDR family oxidoreductase [Paraburkholderia megapolitana]QDQ81879.1 SDR family oxidoreductase [Paraburkholderia megapolitana]SFH86790.1 Nucleoside-diphosphate-sugar epimerase [Paraburkholderia megapolitana]
MRIFVTGATGFIGATIVHELINAGHQVLGLTRSEAGVQSLTSVGAEVHRGDIVDLDSLRRGASSADGVIHTAFNHDFSKMLANCEADRQAVEAMGSALHGSDRPLIITSVAALGTSAYGKPATEDNFNPDQPNPRKVSESTADALAQRGVRVSVVRLPQVHNPVKLGLISYLIKLAREKGVSAYIDDGLNRWAAVHLSDAARLYLLALEKRATGIRYHAVAEEGVPLRTIAEVIGRNLNVPVTSIAAPDAPAHFGWLSAFVGADMSASSALTQERLAWQPTGPGLIADLEQVR